MRKKDGGGGVEKLTTPSKTKLIDRELSQVLERRLRGDDGAVKRSYP